MNPQPIHELARLVKYIYIFKFWKILYFQVLENSSLVKNGFVLESQLTFYLFLILNGEKLSKNKKKTPNDSMFGKSGLKN